MSMLLMVKAMRTKVGNPLRKLVLIKLADNANDNGECWPSYQHIADQCEISKRSVINHINALCESGLMRKEYRDGPKGNSSNLYHLTLGGAGDSLEVVQEIHQGGAGDSLGGSAGAAPRTSHSLEPVNEPIRDQLADTRKAIPFEEIFSAYARELPTLPQIRIKDEARKRAIKSIWSLSDKFQSVEFFERYFRHIGKSEFLMGAKAIGFDWLMKPANFKKVIEGNYHNA